LAAFYLISVLAGGFSNILAYGLMHMGGLGHLDGWRWIFVSHMMMLSQVDVELTRPEIIEGLLTQVISVASWFLIIDFPDKACQKISFISAEDAEFIKKRIDNDRGDAVPDSLSWDTLKGHFLDWKLWMLYVFPGIVPYDYVVTNQLFSSFMFMSTTMPA
jgi:hypothetical protein